MSRLPESNADWSQTTGKLIRNSLGNFGSIGELYDATTETFCSRSLFSSDLPKQLIKSQQNSKYEIEYSYEDQLSNRFNLLKVEPELQLSVLLGLCKLQGHVQYLNEEKESESTASCSLLYNFSTVCEKLIASFHEVRKYMDEDVFDDDQYTHVAVEINWGANCTVSLECHSSDLNEKKKVECAGMLKACLTRLGYILDPKVKGKTCYSKEDVALFKDFRLKIHADILPDGYIANTVEKAVKLLSKLPKLIEKVNDGKGKPLNYVMIPISVFKKLADHDKPITTMIKTIDDSFIINLVCFFEDLAILKQRLHDLRCAVSLNEKYLPQDLITRIRKMEQDIKTNETKLKCELAEDLPKVRAGKIMMRDLIRKAEKHKSTGLNLYMIENFIEESAVVKSKIDEIDFCRSKNIIYVGKNESLDYFMNRNVNYDFFVMYTSRTLRGNNEGLFRKMWNFFLAEAESPKNNSQFIIFDFDVTSETGQTEELKVVHYKGGQVISSDVYKDHEAENAMNFARLVRSSKGEYVQYKPNNRVTLKLQCPGFRLGSCPRDPLIWTCAVCRDNLEYGFDDFFYCACGKGLVHSYELKCSSLNHGNKYLLPNDHFPLKDELGKLRPLDEMNILILGQSGVGKSTWINSIINYLQYETLEDAEKGGVLSVIPANFTVTYTTDKESKQQVVEVGENDINEVTEVGKSATQEPKTYNFILSDRAVRLIDTPGLGDTEGIDRDKENMKKILDHIGYLKEIHGICILLKANERRIDVLFRFCIMELLIHLHKSAARNILFCFTNARTSFYSPGDTSVVLGSLLRALKLDDMITLCNRTMFCLDNEAFRFLCTLKYPNIPRKAEDRHIYGGSWTKSVAETQRLFEQIKELRPHVVMDTTSLCKARNRILNLTIPIVEITQTIQLNLAAIAEQEESIKYSKLSLDELARKLYMPHIELQAEPLPYPRTVCTNSTCVKYHKLEKTDVTITEYTQICHDQCLLSDIVTETYPQSGLRRCAAMNCGRSRNCRKCNCDWDSHMHITYIQKQVEKTVIDTAVENEMKDKMDAKDRIEEHKRQLEEKTKKYEDEQKTIIKVSLQFGLFLRENAIAPYNDGFKDYLKYLIRREEIKLQKTQVENNLLKNLNDMMLRYEEEVKILEKTMEDSGSVNSRLSPEDIVNLESKLYKLELTGKQIKQSVEMSVVSNAQAQKYNEQPLPIRNRHGSFFGSDSNKKTGIVQKCLNYFSSMVDQNDTNNALVPYPSNFSAAPIESKRSHNDQLLQEGVEGKIKSSNEKGLRRKAKEDLSENLQLAIERSLWRV